MPTTHEPVLKTCLKDVCSVCGAEVWISPGGKAAATRVGVQPICVDCTDRLCRWPKNPDKLIQPEQMPELLNMMTGLGEVNGQPDGQ